MKNNDNEATGFLVGGGFILAGVGTFFYQIYYWLQNGEWLRLSVIDLGKYIYANSNTPNELASWVYYPTEWIGVHTMLDHIAITLFAIAIGAIIIGIASSD